MRERYLKDNCAVRLGNLASSLLRLGRWAREGEHPDEAVIDLMREIAWFMEWNGDLGEPELADMQREICGWRRLWPLAEAGSLLALRSSLMSEKVLGWSGLSAGKENTN